MDKESLKQGFNKMRFSWNYLLTGFFIFVLVAILLYFENNETYSLIMPLIVFLLYFLLRWLESFFVDKSKGRQYLTTGGLTGFLSLVLLLAAFFLDWFAVWNYWPYYIAAFAGNILLAFTLKETSMLIFNYLEHKIDANSIIRTPENLKKIQMFWRVLIVLLIYLVVLFSFVMAAEKTNLFLFFIIVSFFTSFVMFKFTQLFQNSIIRKHLIGTSNASFVSVIFFLFSFVFDKLGIVPLLWITLVVAIFSFSVSIQRISFIGWFVR